MIGIFYLFFCLNSKKNIFLKQNRIFQVLLVQHLYLEMIQIQWDTLLGYKASTFVRNFTALPSFHLGVIIWLLLGDTNISLWSTTSKTARLTFSQS